jgi:hypothetical protein
VEARLRVDMRRLTRGPEGEVLTPAMGSGDDLVAAWVEEAKGTIVLTIMHPWHTWACTRDAKLWIRDTPKHDQSILELSLGTLPRWVNCTSNFYAPVGI